MSSTLNAERVARVASAARRLEQREIQATIRMAIQPARTRSLSSADKWSHPDLRYIGSMHHDALMPTPPYVQTACRASPPYNMKYFYSFFGIVFQFYFYLFFLTEAAQYECLCRRTAHHATQ